MSLFFSRSVGATCVFGAVFMATVYGALADELPKLRVGVWEQSTKLDAPQFKGLPPALAQELVRQLGEKKTRLCVTKEDQQKLTEGFFESSDGSCSVKDVTRKGSVYSWTADCSGSHPAAGKGNVVTRFTMNKPSDDAYSLMVETKGAMRGKEIQQSMMVEGRFLGEDCSALGAKTGKQVIEEAKKRGQELAKNPFITGAQRGVPQEARR